MANADCSQKTDAEYLQFMDHSHSCRVVFTNFYDEPDRAASRSACCKCKEWLSLIRQCVSDGLGVPEEDVEEKSSAMSRTYMS